MNLFEHSSPPNVTGLVVAVVVDSINRQFRRWSASYVGKECLKVITPFIANRDTPSAVIFVSGIFGIEAAVFYRVPNSIFSGFSKLFTLTVNKFVFSTPISTIATAAFRKTIAKICPRNLPFSAAIATTEPIGSTAFSSFSRDSQNRPATKSLVAQIKNHRRTLLCLPC